jgi:hypothetical protein
MKPRLLLLLLAAAAFAAGAFFGLGPPRLTLVNAGLRIDHPASQGLGRLLAAAGLGLSAYAVGHRWGRALLAAAAAAAAASGVGRLAYRVDAGGEDVALRDWTGTTRLAWSAVVRVDDGPRLILIWGPGDSQVRLETGAFTAEQRAVLDRTIARRVREGGERAGKP